MSKDEVVKLIWDYMLMEHELSVANAIFVFCSNDTRVAEYAADLYHKGLGMFIVVSGDGTKHESEMLRDTFKGRTEADVFREILIARNVPPQYVFTESKANNTSQNFIYTKKLIDELELRVTKAIIVQKPYMERRTYATGLVQWPRLTMMVTSPPLSYDEYVSGDIDEETVINLMLGDLERIKKYPEKGYQAEQDIPSIVWNAFEYLVSLGYDKHLIKE